MSESQSNLTTSQLAEECFSCSKPSTTGRWIPEGEFICGDCIAETREKYVRSGFSFSWDTVDGEVAYNDETEEWTLDGHVEGRMSPLVARLVLAKLVACSETARRECVSGDAALPAVRLVMQRWEKVRSIMASLPEHWKTQAYRDAMTEMSGAVVGLRLADFRALREGQRRPTAPGETEWTLPSGAYREQSIRLRKVALDYLNHEDREGEDEAGGDEKIRGLVHLLRSVEDAERRRRCRERDPYFCEFEGCDQEPSALCVRHTVEDQLAPFKAEIRTLRNLAVTLAEERDALDAELHELKRGYLELDRKAVALRKVAEAARAYVDASDDGWTDGGDYVVQLVYRARELRQALDALPADCASTGEGHEEAAKEGLPVVRGVRDGGQDDGPAVPSSPELEGMPGGGGQEGSGAVVGRQALSHRGRGLEPTDSSCVDRDSDRVWDALHGLPLGRDHWSDMHDRVTALLAEVRAETIEACARLIEERYVPVYGHTSLSHAAQAIRERDTAKAE